MSPRPPPSHPTTTTTTTAKTTATATTTTNTTASTATATPPSHPPLCFRSMCRIRCGVEPRPAGWGARWGGGAQLGLVGSAVLEQRQVWRVEEVQMEGIRCKVGGKRACEDVSKVKKLTQVCFR